MKKNLCKIIVALVALILVLAQIPTFAQRVKNESANDNVVVSLYYNDLKNKFPSDRLAELLADYKEIGVTTVSLSPENVNSMVARGDVTNIKYNTLRHKYDDESLDIARVIEENYPEVNYDSQLLITKSDYAAEFVLESLSSRYSDDEYVQIILEETPDTRVFCIYDGTLPTHDLILGYEKRDLDMLRDGGFDICLVLKVQNCRNTGYLDNIQKIIDEYNVKYFNIRDSIKVAKEGEDGSANYEGISDLIKNNNLTLVVTENTNQLSNEKTMGYSKIFADNSKKVLRSYETYDCTNADSTNYMFRYHQHLNSTVDRNMRFITVTQISIKNTDFDTLNGYTYKAAKEYINKITSLGYTVNGEVSEYNYDVNLTLANALAAPVMVLLALLAYMMLIDKENVKLTVAGFIIAVFAFAVSFVMPQGLLTLYSTVWAVIMPCFGMTLMFYLIKKLSGKLHTIPLILIVLAVLVAVMSAGGLVISSLLSGLDYHINNSIFRGIKLSLFVPIIYSAIVFCLMFVSSVDDITRDIKKVLFADIKVYWVLIAGAIGVVAYIYLLRSGNVNTISSLESGMRSFITEVFTARPRTKEFLIGYPCAALLVYYIKKTDLKLVQTVLACGTAILAASISNSFCHVFTDAVTIYQRVLNGLLLGVVVAAAAYILNLALVFAVKAIYRRAGKN